LPMNKKKFLISLPLIIIIIFLGYICIKDLWPGIPVNSPVENFRVFKEKKLKLPARHEPVCLTVVGDIMLSRGVARESHQHGDAGHPFAKIKMYIKGGDIAFGNLENPITPGREITTPEMILRADPGVETALKDAGFTILSLANNHTLDFKRQGLLDTLRYLDQAGIKYAGAGKTTSEAFAAEFIEIKGMKLAFLAFCDADFVPGSYLAGIENPGVAFLDEEKLKEAVQSAKKKADFVVASMHAGAEYEPEPNLIQIRFARLAIDSGADLVLGHHPHVIQKIEKYKGKYIFYSLGNFVFDQKWSQATREGMAAKIFIGPKGVEKIEILPVFINDQDQPQAIYGEEAKPVLKNLKLKLEGVVAPVWDQETLVFKKSIIYTFFDRRPSLKSKLVKNLRFDLDQDGVNEDYSLRDGELKVKTNSQIIWQSPDNWWVDNFFLGDSNNDNIQELNLLVWKSGSFGPHKPFWITNEDMSIKNHLFIFKLVNNRIKPVWQSSNLDQPNYETTLEDLDGDGKNELVVTEGYYLNPNYRDVSIWKWNGWGFTKVPYGEPQN
jgi:poly-gamma-glutamate synthesis protein (capsule biosynthesis protein)